MTQRNTRKTTEEFIQEMNNLRTDLELLEEYPKNRHEKIGVRCKKCGNEFLLSPKSILDGTQCPNCRVYKNIRTPTFKQFKDKLLIKNTYYANGLFSITDDRYLDDDKILQSKHIVCTCNQCGKTWETSVQTLLSGHGCDHCNRVDGSHKRKSKNKTLTQEEFVDKLLKCNDYLEPYDKYINRRTKIGFKCKTCNKIVYMTPNEAFQNHGCSECGIKRRAKNRIKDTFEFYKQVLDANPNNLCLDYYTGMRNKIKTQCGICGHIRYTYPASLLKGIVCNKCGKPSGERKIEEYLKLNNIVYEDQKTFDGLVGLGGGLLLYDFYLPKFNLLIEYQGEFHDGSIRDSYQTPEKKQQQFEHDRRKKQYAAEHNIELLEIWYQDFENTEKILEEKLKNIVQQWLN